MVHMPADQIAGSSPRDASKRSAPTSARTEESHDLLLSSHYACASCDLSFEPPSPQLFSFNSPTGMCLTCQGMGETFDFDVDLLVSDARKSFLRGAIDPMRISVDRLSDTSIKLVDFKLSNPALFELPAGDVGIGLGLEVQ